MNDQPVPEPDPVEIEYRPPGPGIGEALLWTGGFHLLQIAGMIAATVCVIAFYVLSGGVLWDGESGQLDPGKIEQLIPEVEPLILAGMQVFLMLGVVLLVRLRLGGDVRRKLNLRVPAPLHVISAMLLIFPLSIVSTFFYEIGHNWIWEPLRQNLPGLRVFDQFDVVQQMGRLIAETPVPILVLAVAIAPAIAEELVFRGIIGRGLVARRGLVSGVLLTSFLFAIVHVHPVHAIGVIPIGIAIHISYLASRSLWIPMLIHFLNNGLALLASTVFPGQVREWPLVSGYEWIQFPVAVLCVVAILAVMWRMRVEYRLPTGELWQPAYPTVEAPPVSLTAVPQRFPLGLGLASFATAAVLIFASVCLLTLPA